MAKSCWNSVPAGNHSEGALKAPGHWAGDMELAARCCAGDEAAAALLIEKYQNPLRAMLIRRGSNDALADDLLANLWGDCCGVNSEKAGLLVKYAGRSSLKTWLATVLTHRLLDSFRAGRECVLTDAMQADETLSVRDKLPTESSLTLMLRGALAAAFGSCDPEVLVMLQLVHLHGLSQRDVAAAWRISEFKVCRQMAKAVRQIRQDALAYVHQKDPLLKLEWGDFVEVCANTGLVQLWAPRTDQTSGVQA